MNALSYLPDYLTSEQRDAILHTDSPLLITAGLGSGKTEIITWRVAHLVRAGLVRPIRGVHAEAMQVSTLQASCADLLRQPILESNEGTDIALKAFSGHLLDIRYFGGSTPTPSFPDIQR